MAESELVSALKSIPGEQLRHLIRPNLLVRLDGGPTQFGTDQLQLLVHAYFQATNWGAALPRQAFDIPVRLTAVPGWKALPEPHQIGEKIYTFMSDSAANQSKGFLFSLSRQPFHDHPSRGVYDITFTAEIDPERMLDPRRAEEVDNVFVQTFQFQGGAPYP